MSPQAPLGVEAIEKADMILLSHSHWDHITDIRKLMDRFNCPLLCGELTAALMLRLLGCNPRDVYPMTPNLELDFDVVKVRALFGRHTDQRLSLQELTDTINSHPTVDSARMETCMFYGNLEYRNYLIDAPSGMKALFGGNNVTVEQINTVRSLRPEIALLQYTKQKPEELAQQVQAGGIKVLIPHHMDLAKTEDPYDPLIDILEQEVHKVAPDCLVIKPERKKWHHFCMAVTVEP